MKEFIFVFLILFTTCFNSLSQIFSIQWQKCYGGSSPDNPGDIISLANGYLLAGSTFSNDVDIGYHYGAEDGWLMRIDSFGNLLWEISYGGTEGDGFQRILPTLDGNYYLAGGAWSSNGTIDFDPYLNSEDYWIMKIDTSGNIIWQKLFGGNGVDLLYDAVTTSDGGLICVGWSNSEDGNISQYFGGWDTWIVKIDSLGEIQWDKTIGSTDGFEYGYTIIQTADGGYLVGISANQMGVGNITCIPHSYYADGILIKLDSLGNDIWQQCYGGADHDGITLILEIPNGYIFSGYTNSYDGDLTGAGNHGGTDIWMAKIDSAGNSIWHKCLGGSGADFLYNILPVADGYIGIGNSASHNGDVIGNHSTGTIWKDVWVYKIDTNGNLEWQQCFGGAGDEYLLNRGATMRGEQDFVIAATTDYSPSYDVNCDCQNNAYSDYWLLEIIDTIMEIKEIPLLDEIKIFPNPTCTNLNVLIPSKLSFNKTSLSLMDVTHRIIFTVECPTYQIKLDVSSFKPGLYYLIISSDSSFIVKKVLIS